VAWPLPGSHIPNQFVAQIIGAGASFEAAAFWNHAIIVGYLDTQLGFMLAAPSVAAARFSGNPNLYYSKYSWSQLGHTLFLYPSPQVRWSRREITEMLQPSSLVKAFNILSSLSSLFYAVGWNENNWDMNSCGDFMCQPPTSNDRDWSQLTSYQRTQAEGKLVLPFS